MSIALIVNGTPYQNRFLKEEEFHYLYDDVIHIRQLEQYDLTDYKTVLLSCRVDVTLLKNHQNSFTRVLNAGKRVIVFGEVLDNFMPTVEWEDSEVDFSWWVRENGDLPLNQQHADHPLYKHLSVPDMK